MDPVKAAYATFNSAFNKSDAKAVAALYSDGAVGLPPTHNVIRGSAAIEDFFAGLFRNGVTAHSLDLIEAHADGNIVVGAAKWSAKGKDSNGAQQHLAGLQLHVFMKQVDGRFKLMLHTFN